MKTLIEILDGCQVENIISALRIKPEKIIFVGFKQNIKENIKMGTAKLV